jgi:hypothetical protein
MEASDHGEQVMDSREQPLELLEREIAELAAHIHAATCRWLGLVAEFDRREGWASWGCKSCAHWLSYTCALGSGAAREHVRVARRLQELPGIRAAFERGELSYSQVRALSRVATPELEGRLLELARHSTASQLERVLRAYRGVLARELTASEIADGERYLTCEHDADGALVIRGRLPAEEGALLVAALEAGRDQLRSAASDGDPAEACPGPVARKGSGGSVPCGSPSGEMPAETEDSRRPRPSNPDALLLMADTLLASGAAERTGGERYQVVVHVDLDALSGTEEVTAGIDNTTPGTEAGLPGAGNAALSHVCRLEHGEALDPETARRLACEASVVSILERGGRPLSVGHKTRSVPPALRRALASRDQGCCFPGCGQTRFLHAHHIEHWAHGGRTELGNLVQLCAYHHRLIHERGYGLTRGPDQSLIFRRPDGREIPAAPVPRAGSRERLYADNRGRGVDIGSDTTRRHWDGSRLDLALAIDGLVWADKRLNDEVPIPDAA